MKFTFVHAADLHLDAVLPPPATLVAPSGDENGRVRPGTGSLYPRGAEASLPELLREAPFMALRRLVDLCIEKKAAFLLLSGDVFDGSSGSLKARLELRDAVNRLGEHGIHVFWARGNHDPLPPELSGGQAGGRSGERRSANLHVFDAGGQSFAMPWNGSGLEAPFPLSESALQDNSAGVPGSVPPQGTAPGNGQAPQEFAVQGGQASLFGIAEPRNFSAMQDAGSASQGEDRAEDHIASALPGEPDFAKERGAQDQLNGFVDLSRGGVIIHGVSHTGPAVRENLAARLAAERGARQIERQIEHQVERRSAQWTTGQTARQSAYQSSERDAHQSSLPAATRNTEALPRFASDQERGGAAVFSAPRFFQAGVLHCAVGGSSGQHENYAPCLLSDLQKAGYDYWALGHIHLPSVLAAEPPIAYSGSLQGLHVRESGPHGCRVCTVRHGRLEDSSFVPLAPLRWEILEISLSAGAGAVLPEGFEGAESGAEPDTATGFGSNPGRETLAAGQDMAVEELEEFLLERIGMALDSITAEAGPDGKAARTPENGKADVHPAGSTPPLSEQYAPLAVLFRLRLTGRTALDGELRGEKNLAALLERLNRALNGNARLPGRTGKAAILAQVKDIKLETRPDINFKELLTGDNLVAESLRGALRFAGAAARQGAAERAPESAAGVAGNQVDTLTEQALAGFGAAGEPGQSFSCQPSQFAAPEDNPAGSITEGSVQVFASDDSANAELLSYYREPLKSLYKHPVLRQAATELLPPPDAAELAELAAEASVLCLDLFEVER